MAKEMRMDQIKSILECYSRTKSYKKTATSMQCSRNTVRRYVRRVSSSGLKIPDLLGMKDTELFNVFYKDSKSPLEQKRQDYFNSKFGFWVNELRKVGVTKRLIWEEYLLENPSGYGYSQFCEHFKRIAGRKDLSVSLTHTPGETMQVDFAGKKISYVDLESGELIECEVLVAVFPHSQHTYAIALPSQKIGDFVHGLNKAIQFFGGLPEIILSDNLRSYVTTSDKYEPKFTELCKQLAAHYEITLKAARVRKPKDKASVENSVSIVYNRIYGPLRNEIYHSLEELNSGIQTKLRHHNDTPYQKKDGTRSEIFNNYERPVMRDLPSDIFEIKKMTKAKVRKDYHVEIGEDKHFYSVPFRYCGKSSLIIYTRKTVEIYIDNQRVAVHERMLNNNKFCRKTNTDHMPKSHQEWEKSKGRTPAYFTNIAEQVGPATLWVINKILLRGIHPAQTFSSCSGVLHLRNKYSNSRLEKACERCQIVDHASYNKIKNILINNYDIAPTSSEIYTSIEHENIRGSQNYFKTNT